MGEPGAPVDWDGAYPVGSVNAPGSPNPRTMTVLVPFSLTGLTIVTMDPAGNMTIKVEQPPS